MNEEIAKSILEVVQMGKVTVYRSSFEEVIGDEASLQSNKVHFKSANDKIIEAKLRGDSNEFWTRAAIRLLQDQKGMPSG